MCDKKDLCEFIHELKEAHKQSQAYKTATYDEALDEWNNAVDDIDTPNELSEKVESLYSDLHDAEERVEELEECKDITMNDLTTAEKEGDETLEEYVKMRIDKYILEGSLVPTDPS